MLWLFVAEAAAGTTGSVYVDCAPTLLTGLTSRGDHPMGVQE